ncbi:MAG TPA: YbjN domain-containing protein [Egicoccus sp.]|nr:YbjN domain-containing protein [Egicoccus sp.]HSK22350.1 YbjN domain-containing protein [Egicoccus sp.]
MSDAAASPSSTAFGFLVDTLRASGLVLTEHPEQSTVSFLHAGERSEWSVFCRAREGLPQVAVYSLYPHAVPASRRGVVGELLTRANYGLFIGNFEMDLDDGEVRFKTSLDFAGDRLSGALLAGLIEHNLASFERYLPTIDAATAGGVDVEAMLAAVEGDARS